MIADREGIPGGRKSACQKPVELEHTSESHDISAIIQSVNKATCSMNVAGNECINGPMLNSEMLLRLAEMYDKLEQKAITSLDVCLDENLREI